MFIPTASPFPLSTKVCKLVSKILLSIVSISHKKLDWDFDLESFIEFDAIYTYNKDTMYGPFTLRHTGRIHKAQQTKIENQSNHVAKFMSRVAVWVKSGK